MKKLSLILLTLSAFACNKPAGDANAKRKKEAGDSAVSTNNGMASMSAQATDNAVDERVDIPSNISGAFLSCAVRKEGKDADPSMEIGCVLKDKDSLAKIENADIAFSASDKDGVDVVPQDGKSLYNVLYRLRSYDLKTLVEKAEALEAIATYKNILLKREKVYNVLKPAIELEDYEAPIVRDQGIKPDDDGSL